jgi:hypothetical protein
MAEEYDERRMFKRAFDANNSAHVGTSPRERRRGEDTMKSTNRRLRLVAVLVTAFGILALLGVLAVPSHAAGVTREKLVAQGWTCVEFVPANRWSCFNPGLGRPFPGNPDPRPSYNFLGFDRTSGDFIYTGHLIRQDLYAGEPCGPGGEPYIFRALIGYYECVHS